MIIKDNINDGTVTSTANNKNNNSYWNNNNPVVLIIIFNKLKTKNYNAKSERKNTNH